MEVLMLVRYERGGQHEIVFLENVWRAKIRCSWLVTLQHTLGYAFPDDILGLIASFVAPPVIQYCRRITADTYEVV